MAIFNSYVSLPEGIISQVTQRTENMWPLLLAPRQKRGSSRVVFQGKYVATPREMEE